jgi:hypothetical protein
MAINHNNTCRFAFRKGGPNRAALKRPISRSPAIGLSYSPHRFALRFLLAPTRRPERFAGIVTLGGGLDTLLPFAVFLTDLFNDPIR